MQDHSFGNLFIWLSGKSAAQFHCSLSPPSALHLDSRSRSSFQAFAEPPSPLGSRGEEEEDEEGASRGLLFLSFPSFSLSIDQLTSD